MAAETLRLTSYAAALDPLVVDVEYVETKHYLAAEDATNRDGGSWKAYEIVVAGKALGTVEQVTESTDRHIKGTRFRRPGRGRLAWTWRRADGTSGPAGLYESSRRTAAAYVLGYTRAEKVS